MKGIGPGTGRPPRCRRQTICAPMRRSAAL